MRSVTIVPGIALCCAFLGACSSSQSAPGASTAPTQSREEALIERVIEARGGLDRIRVSRPVQFRGEIDMSSAGMILPVTITLKRPSMMLMVVSVPEMAMEVSTGYDGQVAWADNPTQGGLQQLSGEQARSTKEQADTDGFLVDHAAKGYSVDYIGEETVREVNTQKLRIVRADSSEIYLYFDSETYLQVKTKQEVTHPMTGAMATMETFLSDFRDVDGVLLPFMTETLIDGQSFQSILLYDVEVGIEVDDAIFALPDKR